MANGMTTKLEFGDALSNGLSESVRPHRFVCAPTLSIFTGF